ncbi:OST-HTH/LOTUS domain-containing protein [Novosphingobium sp. 1949]|uniref:OST-HTH/LOTUS domain-containing protein n=1 Tax=Novosphingobium organovorum TaxID=2930092 RepID=A0ABT0BI32_9SPHN|nr:OST-HTH/LOTUS domain-containing protein [Novosphingobium organovorum]MCJ2184712.1 OST-HTH/LOTUS domain-containing protein [Novosphingobium organovorum]
MKGRISSILLQPDRNTYWPKMSQSPPNALQVIQRELSEKLGQCVLNMQTYETLIKSIIAHHEISGSTLSVDTDSRTMNSRKKTLGTLVNEMLGSFLTAEETSRHSDAAFGQHGDGPSFHIKIGIAVSADDYNQIVRDLKDFVSLRNDLIHHFLERHDIASYDGCRVAEKALIEANHQIERHLDDLRTWGKDLDQAKLAMAELVQSAVVQDFLVTGKIPWPATEAVRAFRAAAAEFSADGWTLVSIGSDLIAAQHPTEAPSNYGCSSWRQVLHDSGLFELQYRKMEGRRTAWYREKRSSYTNLQ